MSSVTYSYQKPNLTYTLDQYITCQSDSVMSYHNLSFVDIRDNIAYDTYNVLSDYIDEIHDQYCVSVTLSQDQMLKYKYRPKLLCHDIYGNGELAFLIMIINDMCNVKDFTRQKIYMPRRNGMVELTRFLFNANSDVIKQYNKNNTT